MKIKHFTNTLGIIIVYTSIGNRKTWVGETTTIGDCRQVRV